MKRLLNFLIAVTIVCVVLVCTTVLPACATEDLSKVGYYGGNGLWEEFDESEINQITALIRAEFNRSIKTRSEMHKGTRYFDYGESTGEYVHRYYGKPVSSYGESLGILIGCMIQDFGGGYSTRPAAFDGRPKQWCCIVVTRDSLDKGEAYTIRDAIAGQYTMNGDVHGSWGLPTSNQYWVVEDGEEVLYQQFEYGYARARDGSIFDTLFKFHHVGTADYDPDFPKSGSEDRPSYANVPIAEPGVYEPPVAPIEVPTVSQPTFEEEDDGNVSTYTVTDHSDEEEAIEEVEETEQTASAKSDAVPETEDDLAEETASTTVSTMRNLVRRNTAFHDFMLNYWGFLVAGGVVVIGALSVVLVLMKRKAHTK